VEGGAGGREKHRSHSFVQNEPELARA
jgi:hypothetical protein